MMNFSVDKSPGMEGVRREGKRAKKSPAACGVGVGVRNEAIPAESPAGEVPALILYKVSVHGALAADLYL